MPRRLRVDERDPLLRERELVARLAVERGLEVRGDFAAAPLERELVLPPDDRELVLAPDDRDLVLAPDDRELVLAPDDREEVREAADLARVDVDLRPPLLARVPVERELAERDADLRPALDFRAPDDLRPLLARRVVRVVAAVLELDDSSMFHLPESTR